MFNNSSNFTNTTCPMSTDANFVDENLSMLKMYTYRICLPVLIAAGVFGNVLNLITLDSPDLGGVPFIYVRAMAVFDAVSLPLVGVACDRLWRHRPTYGPAFAYYQAHVERPLINVLLTASLFVASALSVERYYLICKPYALRINRTKLKLSAVANGRSKASAKLYILGCVLTSALLHASMPFEKTSLCFTRESESEYACVIADNAKFSGVWLKTSRLAREIVCRALPVLLLAVLNASIVGTVRRLNARRRAMMLTTRQRYAQTLAETTDVDADDLLDASRDNRVCTVARKRSGSYCSSVGNSASAAFRENRLTTMMAAVTVVYVVGNVPQSISMILNSDSKRNDFGYQLFRAFANVMEICHHCSNFYVFCLTCRDYRQSFRRRCRSASRLFWQCLRRTRVVVGADTDSTLSVKHPVEELSTVWFRENESAFLE